MNEIEYAVSLFIDKQPKKIIGNSIEVRKRFVDFYLDTLSVALLNNLTLQEFFSALISRLDE